MANQREELEEDEDVSEEILAKHDRKFVKPLKELNVLRNRDYRIDTLPEHAGEPLPPAALELHRAFWDARRKRQADIDASIARNADTELLCDLPELDKNIVRVCRSVYSRKSFAASCARCGGRQR